VLSEKNDEGTVPVAAKGEQLVMASPRDAKTSFLSVDLGWEMERCSSAISAEGLASGVGVRPRAHLG
jgi:hypothetical protein